MPVRRRTDVLGSDGSAFLPYHGMGSIRRPARTRMRFEISQTLRVWLISGCAFGTKK